MSAQTLNVIYKANYNDGGQDRSKLGFDGVPQMDWDGAFISQSDDED